MSEKYIKKAAREFRVAVLPEWMAEGREIWYWREILCDDELCPDMVGPSCPMNDLHEHIGPHHPEALRCARMHPVLDRAEIWSVAAQFTPRGLRWVINDGIEISDAWLRRAVFPTKPAALAHRPEVIEYG